MTLECTFGTATKPEASFHQHSFTVSDLTPACEQDLGELDCCCVYLLAGVGMLPSSSCSLAHTEKYPSERCPGKCPGVFEVCTLLMSYTVSMCAHILLSMCSSLASCDLICKGLSLVWDHQCMYTSPLQDGCTPPLNSQAGHHSINTTSLSIS